MPSETNTTRRRTKHLNSAIIYLQVDTGTVQYSIVFPQNLKTFSFIIGKELEKTLIIIADVSSEASLAEMCKQAKIVLNCVGPVCTLFSVVKRIMLIISLSQKKS